MREREKERKKVVETWKVGWTHVEEMRWCVTAPLSGSHTHTDSKAHVWRVVQTHEIENLGVHSDL